MLDIYHTILQTSDYEMSYVFDYMNILIKAENLTNASSFSNTHRQCAMDLSKPVTIRKKLISSYEFRMSCQLFLDKSYLYRRSIN